VCGNARELSNIQKKKKNFKKSIYIIDPLPEKRKGQARLLLSNDTPSSSSMVSSQNRSLDLKRARELEDGDPIHAGALTWGFAPKVQDAVTNTSVSDVLEEDIQVPTGIRPDRGLSGSRLRNLHCPSASLFLPPLNLTSHPLPPFFRSLSVSTTFRTTLPHVR
jgi:hypothetical protein